MITLLLKEDQLRSRTGAEKRARWTFHTINVKNRKDLINN
jgi:hypothetical protein